MLYNKYRPKTFDEIIGNEKTIKALTNEETPHSILLTGPAGCGKTTIARILANKLNSQGIDLQEINTADFRGIDTVREIRKNINYKPVVSDARVIIIDEAHQLGVGGNSAKNASQNALLKLLEEPPDHIYFILCTTNPEMLLKTIRSRCVAFEVKPLTLKQTSKLLIKIAKKEGESLDKELIKQIHEESEGHPRKAIGILEKVINLNPEDRLKAAKEFKEKDTEIVELCRVLLTKNPSWNKISSILKNLRNEDPEKIRRTILGYMNSVLLNKDWGLVYFVMEQFEEPTYDIGFPGITMGCYRVCKGE